MYGPRMEATFVSKKTGRKFELVFSAPTNEEKDAKAFVEWFNDNRVRQYLSGNVSLSLSAELDWIKGQNEKIEDMVWFVYIGGQPIGSIGLHRIDLKNAQAELGINIGEKSFWGKGIATVMEAAVVDYAFENIIAGGLHKVFARVFTGNIASQKVLEEKIGFRTIGVKKENVWCNGSWYDEWIGEMLQSEWQKNRKTVIENAGITKLELYPGCEK